MATYVWSNGSGGDWSDAANWSPSAVPGADDTAIISGAGSYAIEIDVRDVGTLILDAPNVIMRMANGLRLESVLDVQAGTLLLSQTIQGGTVVLGGGTIDYAGGTLDGVTVVGTIDLGAAGSSLTITGGIGFTGDAPEWILDTGTGSSLTFGDDEEIRGGVDIVAGNDAGTARLAAQALTLDAGSNLTLVHPDAAASFGAIENQGTLSVVDSTAFQLAAVSGSGTVNIEGSSLSERGLVNAGTLALSDGTTLYARIGGAFSNTGTITVDSTSTLSIENDLTVGQLGTIVDDGGTVLVSGMLDLAGGAIDLRSGSPLNSGFLFNGGTVQNGTIETDGTGVHYGQTTVLSDVTIDGTLAVNGGAAAELDIEDGFGFAGGAPGRIVVTTAGSFLHLYGNQTLDNVAITLGNAYIAAAGTLTLGPASTLTLTADATFGSRYGQETTTDILDNKGTIVAASGGLHTNYSDIGTGGVLQNDGVFAASGGTASTLYQLDNTGSVDISGAASVTAQTLDTSGIVDISGGGSLTVSAQSGDHRHIGQLDNTGIIRISGGGTLTLEDGSTQLGTVSFLDGGGTVVLADVQDFYDPFVQGPASGTLDMFRQGDVLDLGSVRTISSGPPISFSIVHSGNTLTVDAGGTVFDSFALTGQDYSEATFTLDGDIVTTDAPCFCAGTCILTDAGERPVESLAIGDVVVTRQDGIERLQPIRWIGRRRIVVARHPEPERVHPIRIAGGAIAPGIPSRCLSVSPDHALYADGLLIQARQLVNHMTICRDAGCAVVTYYHVELDRHSILMADGMPCESYLETGNRCQFDTPGTVVRLPDGVPDRSRDACAPFATSAELVLPVWRRLHDRALAAGLRAPTPAFEPELEPWLETADGIRLVCMGDGRRHVLPSGCRRVRVRSGSDLPTTLAPWSDDRRRLGVAISEICLHQGARRRPVPLDTLAAGGWWPVETAGLLVWRWTDGDGWIDLPEAADAIELAIHATMRVVRGGTGPGYAMAG